MPREVKRAGRALAPSTPGRLGGQHDRSDWWGLAGSMDGRGFLFRNGI